MLTIPDGGSLSQYSSIPFSYREPHAKSLTTSLDRRSLYFLIGRQLLGSKCSYIRLSSQTRVRSRIILSKNALKSYTGISIFNPSHLEWHCWFLSMVLVRQTMTPYGSVFAAEESWSVPSATHDQIVWDHFLCAGIVFSSARLVLCIMWVDCSCTGTVWYYHHFGIHIRV